METLPSKSIRVLLVDDHQITRVGLRTILSHFSQFDIVGETSNVAGAVAETQRLKPDVVLLDVRLPDGSGFDACRQIQQLNLETRVIILTSYADEETVFQSISAGADGFLLKEIDSETLARSITQVAAGNSILDPAVTQKVLLRVRTPTSGEQKSKLDLLSAQERRVLALVAEGKTNKEVGVSLGLSEKTVKNYFSNILDKLKMSRRSQAAAFFVQQTPSKS